MELPITAPQAHYLNRIAIFARQYREVSASIEQSLKNGLHALDGGHIPQAIRHQDATDIVRLAGQLDALASIAYTVFPPTEHLDADLAVKHNKMVAGYLNDAFTLEDNDYITVTFN